MSGFIFSAIIFSSSLVIAQQTPSFYGFTIGEKVSESQKNMKSRDLYFIDSATNAKNSATKRSVFEVMKNPDNCTEETNKELNTVSCTMTKGDVESLALFYLNDKLIRIVAKFRGHDEKKIKKQLSEKFTGKQVEANTEMIQEFESLVSRKVALDAILVSPFALKGKCDSCNLTMFVQSNVTDGVFYMTNESGLYLTLYSMDLVKSELSRISETNLDKKKTSF
mgnify:CR=1 FL=1